MISKLRSTGVPHPLACGLLAALLPALLPAMSAAQERPGPQREPLRLEAKLEDMAPGLLQVVTPSGDRLLVKVEAQPRNLSFVGQADAAWLRPGMFVRFSATLDKRGQSRDEITQLTVFTPSEAEPLGLLAEGGFAGGGVFSGDPTGEPVKKKPVEKAQSYTVAGQVVSFRNGKLQVAAGDAGVKVEVADEAKISVDVADISLARKGDAVKIQGWRYAEAPGKAVASQVAITAAEPLSGESKRKRPTRERKPADEEASADGADGAAKEDGAAEDGAAEDGGAKEEGKEAAE